ncbi:DUF4157 domain-containing protein [Sphingomonas sp. Sphisp140]|uniref:eCIS core domain-containing protein n=1 Tax=unclassified Sphingomonas TaxID=196159 RepID=UPI0039AF09BB
MRAAIAAPPETVASYAAAHGSCIQRKASPGANRTGLPDGLKHGIEAMSGLSLDAVRVHRNSSMPAHIDAEAYAHGRDIHLAPGRESHLPHEAWHVIQQMQGRVRPTAHTGDGTAVNDDAGLEREADTMGARALAAPASMAPMRAAQTAPAAPVVQGFKFMAGPRWLTYKGTLQNEQACNAIDTWEAKTTMQLTRDGNGQVTHRRITLHAYQNDAWHAVGSITMDRTGVQPMGAADQHGNQPPLVYDDSELTLHTAAAGGAGNAGVATHLFPAVLRWIDANLHGVHRINMNPLGGAASKSVIENLSARLGDPTEHATANAARAVRKQAGGPGIGSAGAAPINTWDARLNDEHLHDLHALQVAAPGGLHISGDGVTIVGPATPHDQGNMQLLRDYFVNRPPGDLTRDVNHPAHGYFEAARALTNVYIANHPQAAARILRIARLASRSGATGHGGTIDPGYQIAVSGNALTTVLPNASQ